MARLGYKCDRCGSEHPGVDPAAYIDGEELCSDCYDKHLASKGDPK